MLITRPNHDNTTNYLYEWSKYILDFAHKAKTRMVDLAGSKVTKSNFTSYVKKLKPGFIMINGHGNNDSVCGQKDEVLVKKNENEDILKDIVVYARSCSSASGLGKSCAKKVNTTYIGYDADYFFMFDEDKLFHPLKDDTAKMFLEPSNYIAISLLKGYTAQEADAKSKDMIKQNIFKLLAKTESSEDQSMLPLMMWNYNHQVCLGNGNAKVR
ncbi:hypothetical protein MUP32_06455 [Candidatus Microgenomates bacterium]|nr:hypothetical protein [Candidatus Microgenomates bacterium]